VQLLGATVTECSFSEALLENRYLAILAFFQKIFLQSSGTSGINH